MSAIESEIAWSVPGLTLSEKAILAFITCKARTDLGHRFWWGQAAMGKTLGISKDTLQRHLKVLEQRGFITRHPRFEDTPSGNVQRRSDLITVHLDFMRTAATPVPEGDEPAPENLEGVAVESGHLAAEYGQGSRNLRPGVAVESGHPGRKLRQQNPGIEPRKKNPGRRTLESEPRVSSPGTVRASSDEPKKNSPSPAEDPEPMTFEDERKRQQDALERLIREGAA